METSNEDVFAYLRSSIHLKIPLYQRCYSWSRNECRILFEDITTLNKNNNIHFIGSIVMESEKGRDGLKVYNLIDGQQRLITIILLLIALRDLKSKELKEKNIDEFLLNNEKDNLKYKIFPSNGDKEFLINRIKRGKNENLDSKIDDNYRHFCTLIEEMELTPIGLYNAIGKLHLVCIKVEAKDDPQGIFESLNSKGKDIKVYEQIKNYLLIGISSREQERIYTNYWEKIEKKFEAHKNDEEDNILDKFFRDYLIAKSNELIKSREVYREFKKYKIDSNKNNDEFCKDILEHATWYTNMLFYDSVDKELNILYKEISRIQISVCYPFLLKVHNDCINKNFISIENLKNILGILISYGFRSKICKTYKGIANNIFIELQKEIKKTNYVDSITECLSKNFPSNEEFYKSFMEYKLNDRVKYLVGYLLEKINNFQNKHAHISYGGRSGYTIEHIMPKKLDLKWKEDLGENYEEIHKKYEDTIGNLTLTRSNSEMGNRSFLDKLETLKEGPLILNNYINEQNLWGEKQIIERTKKLYKHAEKIWDFKDIKKVSAFKTELKEGESLNSCDHFAYYKYYKDIYEKLNEEIISLGKNIKREIKKLYLRYKIGGFENFAKIEFLKSYLKLSLKIEFESIKDPKGICETKNRERKSKQALDFDTIVKIYKNSNVKDIINLIKQVIDNIIAENKNRNK